jgi:RNA polymerase sigma-32 factor
MTTRDSYDTFVRRAMKFEMLEPETERELARAWRDHRDTKAVERLVQAHLRLAISLAGQFHRRYGVSKPDLIQEAAVGLMKAAEKFDPERGMRFSTYAIWWMKAAIKEYVVRNRSIVRTGSSASQKKLFFNLNRVRTRLKREAALRGDVLNDYRLRELIAEDMGVSLKDVELMEARLAGSDFSLNVQRSSEDESEWIEALEDESPQTAETVTRDVDLCLMRDWLTEAMEKTLTERERLVITERKLRDEPRTLKSIGDEIGLSNERVRQIEARAFKKMRDYLELYRKEVRQLCSA